MRRTVLRKFAASVISSDSGSKADNAETAVRSQAIGLVLAGMLFRMGMSAFGKRTVFSEVGLEGCQLRSGRQVPKNQQITHFFIGADFGAQLIQYIITAVTQDPFVTINKTNR